MTTDPITALRYERLHATPPTPQPALDALRTLICVLDQALTDDADTRRRRQHTYDPGERP